MKCFKNIFSLYIVAVVFSTTAILFSCNNDIKKVNSIANASTLPIQVGTNVEIIYSEKADILAKLTTPLLKRFENDKPYTEMPKGIKILFYDSIKQVDSKLIAKYAISYEVSKIMEAKNDVQVTNKKGELLNTEHLVWDQKKEKIYSDVFVKVTTKDEVMWGEGFESDQYFEKWEIKKPKGVISIKQN
ncbi:MAG: LPS export ABC transporter periplasmic protein LptC [Bacteroidota bacterium]